MKYRVLEICVSDYSKLEAVMRSMLKVTQLPSFGGSPFDISLYPGAEPMGNETACFLAVESLNLGADKVVLSEYNQQTNEVREFFVNSSAMESFQAEGYHMYTEDGTLANEIQPAERFMFLCETIGENFDITGVIVNDKDHLGDVINFLHKLGPETIGIDYYDDEDFINIEVRLKNDFDVASLAGIEHIFKKMGAVPTVDGSIYASKALSVFRKEYLNG